MSDSYEFIQPSLEDWERFQTKLAAILAGQTEIEMVADEHPTAASAQLQHERWRKEFEAARVHTFGEAVVGFTGRYIPRDYRADKAQADREGAPKTGGKMLAFTFVAAATALGKYFQGRLRHD